MQLLNKIDIILNVVLIISLVVSYFVMEKVKSQANISNNQNQLNKNEKIIIWITCLFAPFFSGLIYYFGWKKVLPIKAKQANNILWLSLLVLAFIGFTISALS